MCNVYCMVYILSSDIMPQGDFMTINLYPMIYCCHFYKAASFKQLHWCGKELRLRHSKVFNIWYFLPSDNLKYIKWSNNNNDYDSHPQALKLKTEEKRKLTHAAVGWFLDNCMSNRIFITVDIPQIVLN